MGHVVGMALACLRRGNLRINPMKLIDVSKERRGYLIDMDGVIYRGSQVIPGAQRFIVDLHERDIPFRFLTNNSQRSRLDVATKLQRLGF